MMGSIEENRDSVKLGMGHYANLARALSAGLLLLVSLGLTSARAEGGMSSSGVASPNRVVPGGTVSINALFNSAISLDNVNLALEVHDPTGARVFQKVIPGQSFVAGQDQSYSTRWPVPQDLAPGQYSVQLGAFSTDWSISYGWNGQAAAIDVAKSFAGLESTTYYVDCNEGDDANPGTAPTKAWSTLAPANAALLQPGDSLRLRRDCDWTGPLTVGWTGTQAHPVTVEGFGTGNLPRIESTDFAGVSVTGSYVVFDGLNVNATPALLDDSCKEQPVGYRLGFYFGPGSTNNVVKNSVVENAGAGIDIGSGSSGNTITHNELLNNNMMFDTDPWTNDGGGDGILIEGDSNDVSFNHIAGSYACSRRYPADGSAVELSGATNNRIHHNHIDSNWIFAEISRSSNNDFAYNVSTNGGFTVHDDSSGTSLYNNVFYVPGGGVVSCYPCPVGALSLVNNIFVADTAMYTQGPVTENHNLFWVRSGGPPATTQRFDPTSIVADPQFVDPANGDFHLLPTSPAVNAGSTESVQAGDATDMDGKTVPQGPAVDIGVYEQ